MDYFILSKINKIFEFIIYQIMLDKSLYNKFIFKVIWKIHFCIKNASDNSCRLS